MLKNGFGTARFRKKTALVFFSTVPLLGSTVLIFCNGSVAGSNGTVARWNGTVVGATGDKEKSLLVYLTMIEN